MAVPLLSGLLNSHAARWPCGRSSGRGRRWGVPRLDHDGQATTCRHGAAYDVPPLQHLGVQSSPSELVSGDESIVSGADNYDPLPLSHLKLPPSASGHSCSTVTERRSSNACCSCQSLSVAFMIGASATMAAARNFLSDGSRLFAGNSSKLRSSSLIFVIRTRRVCCVECWW